LRQAHQQGDDLGDRALLDDECAVHVGFAQPQLRVEQHRALRLRIGEAHGEGRTGAVAKGASIARGCRDPKRAAADKPI